MSGRLINGIKYVYIYDDYDNKKKSLEDNVYFTLRDIFWNCDSLDTCLEVNSLNEHLTGGVCFEERNVHFKYTNILHEKDYVARLQRWLTRFSIYYFKFFEIEKGEEIDYAAYIKYDDWLVDFEKLRQLIDQQYEMLKGVKK